MTRRDTLKCIHEPFGDAWYFGPERLGTRYENDEKARLQSGFAESTYKSIFDRIERDNSEVSVSSYYHIPIDVTLARLRHASWYLSPHTLVFPFVFHSSPCGHVPFLHH